MNRSSRLVLLSLIATGLATAPAPAQTIEDPALPSFWTPHYLADYGLTLAGLYLGAVAHFEPSSRARIGPSFDPGDPVAIFDPAHTTRLGGTFTPERDWTVSDFGLKAMTGGHLVVIPAHELLAARATRRDVSLHRLHDSALSAAEATAAAATVTALVKAWTGRLRPDFQDRVRHVYCSLPDPGAVDCNGVDPGRLFDDPQQALDELENGRASFPSGHASMGMVVATNLALQTGALWVWHPDATPASRRAGIAAMAAIGGAGAFIGLSRTSLMDGVHHPSDVLVGGLIGVAAGNLFHWLHFDTDGQPRGGHWLARSRAGTALAPFFDDLRVTSDGQDVILLVTWRTGAR
jgi:membrane-associated phospholipid phosphatase